MRQLDKKFMDDLKSGYLNPILEKIQKDDTLSLCIRDKYINVYHRGGSLLKLSSTGKAYAAEFNKDYAKGYAGDLLTLPETISNIDDAKDFVNKIPLLKDIMDEHFANAKDRTEREFAQLILRENSKSRISNLTDYFICDMEYSYKLSNGKIAKPDLIAIKLNAKNKSTMIGQISFIEVKYGDGAFTGSAGIKKHCEDIAEIDSALINSFDDLKLELETMFTQLCDLGLLKFEQPKKCKDALANGELCISIDNSKIEYLFALANTNPRSEKLSKCLSDSSKTIENLKAFEVKYVKANHLGYGFFKENIFDIKELEKEQ